MAIEFQRNRERYEFLKWGTQAFNNFNVVPPGVGIVHQVNLEYLARGCGIEREGVYLYPDSLVGTDSHTTMIGGLGVVGWGVGGIEAEAGMLGQPVYFLTPDVVGVHLSGALQPGVTATDLVLTLTELLRGTRSSASSSSSSARARPRCRSPTARRSATWRPSTGRRSATSRSTSDLRVPRADRAHGGRRSTRSASTTGAGDVRHARARGDRLQRAR
jgi:hypothetical protein